MLVNLYEEVDTTFHDRIRMQLRRAADRAGFEVSWSDQGAYMRIHRFNGTFLWTPATDLEDAMELANNTGICIDFKRDIIRTGEYGNFIYEFDNYEQIYWKDTLCRAIVYTASQ